MSHNESKTTESAAIAVLRADLARLKDELLTSKITRDVGYEMANEIRLQYNRVCERNQWLEARNKALENPEPNYKKLGWMGKILFCIRKQGRPLRKREIMDELEVMDKSEGALKRSWNPDKLISSVLSRGVQSKRVYLFDISGTRGAYYAAEEWVDKNGKLDTDMLFELM